MAMSLCESAMKFNFNPLEQMKKANLTRYRKAIEKPPLPKWSLSALALHLESAPIYRILIRINQCLPIVALSVALLASYFAYQGFTKSREDKRSEAWKIVLSASGKKVNFGQVAALEKLRNEDNASFAHVELANTMLKAAKLRKADFSFANLAGTDFEGANLQFANFTGANLKGANFAGADLTGVEFADADLSNTNMKRATIDARILYAKNLHRADITGANFVYGSEYDEDGEQWAAFSDTMGEDPNDYLWQKISMPSAFILTIPLF
jgi:Pentapeptide repeats (8 copies)